MRSAGEWDLDPTRVRVLTERARNITITAHGLNHWSGDRKQVVLTGWARLARDIEWLRDQIDRDSLYNAGVVLDDLLQIYSASHTYELTQRATGIDAVRDVLRPSISGGFAARAGLMRNLDDHIEYLRSSIERDDSIASDIEERLQAATALRDAARADLRSSAEPLGKDERQAAVLPPPLAEFAADYDGLAVALSGIPQTSLDRLAIDLADRHSARALEPDLVITSVRKKIVTALEDSPDFEGEVATAVTEVLDQLIRFVARRMNTQESSKAYLFKDDADESDLHKDLYDWLCQGQFTSNTNAEVQEVGAGRTDIQIVFPGFNLYLELKVDDTMVPVAGKSAYIKQTVTYQATEVRIGFLVVLRLSPPRDKGPAPHLRDYVSHTTKPVPGDSEARHVVMLEIPGRQTKPSSMR